MIDKLSIDFDLDDRGVSPVIGVILMVAITVILAAVIGAFVLNLGSSLGSTGPTAQLSVSDASASVSDAGANVLNIEHKGGDDLQRSELKVIVKQDGTIVDSDAELSSTDFGADADNRLVWSSPPSTEITVGDTLTVKEGSADDITSGTYTVQVIHKPSNSMLVNSQIDIN